MFTNFTTTSFSSRPMSRPANQSAKRRGAQRGAMFGLDARIALAIFGGLSAIAGMAVFGTIRQTDVTSLLTELDNISKGYINYAFDTGIDIPEGSADGEGFKALYVDSTSGTLGWNGPYITRSSDLHPKFGAYDIVRGQIDATGIPTSTDPTGVNGAWVELTSVPCEIAEELDEEIDGDTEETNDSDPSNVTGQGVQLDPDDGNLRHTACSPGDETEIYFLLSRLMGS